MDDDERADVFEKACKADDSAEFMAIIKAMGCKAGSEITHSKTPLEYAMEHDAPKCFQTLLDSGKAVMKTRLWGGQRPIHHCGYSSTYGSGRGAPKCLAVALAKDPDCVTWADEEERGSLDWAAMNPLGDTFAPMLAAAIAARDEGRISDAKLREMATKAAIYSVLGCTSAKACMGVLAELDKVGLDWRSLRSKHGQSLLGTCFDGYDHQHSLQAGILMLQAGADPMSRYVKEPAYYEKGKKLEPAVSCLEHALGYESMALFKSPAFFGVLISKVSNEVFLDKVVPFLEDNDEKSFRVATRGSVDNPHPALLDRQAALLEAKVLDKESPAAPVASSRSKPRGI